MVTNTQAVAMRPLLKVSIEISYFSSVKGYGLPHKKQAMFFNLEQNNNPNPIFQPHQNFHLSFIDY